MQMHMLTGNDVLRGRADARAVFDHGIACPQGPQGEFVTEGDVLDGRDVPVAGFPEQADRARIDLAECCADAVRRVDDIAGLICPDLKPS